LVREEKLKEESGGGASYNRLRTWLRSKPFTYAFRLRTKSDPHEKFTENHPGSSCKPSEKMPQMAAQLAVRLSGIRRRLHASLRAPVSSQL
jgi:hypothetical protein